MRKMIGSCGYNCHLCAARSDDPAERQKLVDGWRKYFGHQVYDVENVRCDGCRAEGRLADKQCKVRPCARARGVESCAECGDFPCATVRPLMAHRDGLLLHCYPRTANITTEDYNRCMRQFESMPNLLKTLARLGKLPKPPRSSGTSSVRSRTTKKE